jgi:hypothetical protein
MEILPPRTQPPEIPIRRRHVPKQFAGDRGYQRYRSCLRWDFGFTCAFCLLHEADFADPRGLRGSSAMTIEHRTLRRDEPERSNDYGNCFLACCYCNRARGIKPVHEEDSRLLDPTVVAWNHHFELDGDHLRPISGDLDAAYTHRAYDLDDPIKVELRRFRRETYEDRLSLLETANEEIDWLWAWIRELTHQGRLEEAKRFLNIMHSLEQAQHAALRELARFRAIPRDAPASCSCETDPARRLGRPALTLPEPIAAQVLELEDQTRSS